MPITKCQNVQCGREFYYRSKGKVRRFCSTDCVNPNRFEVRTEANCPGCGELFIMVDSNNKNIRRVTCGKQKCQKSRKDHPNYSHKVEVLCSGCDKTFLKTSKQFQKHTANGHVNHYCTNKCRLDYQSKQSAEVRSINLKILGVDENSFRICVECNSPKPIGDFASGTRLKHMCKGCLYKSQCQRWLNRKLWAIAYLGGCCVDCGYDKHWAAFDFHHRDPETKEFDWSKLRLRSIESMKKELDKCDLLCAICHRIRHVKLGVDTSSK